MTNNRTAQLMRVELACVKRGNTCNRKCAECDLVQKDTDLIEAYQNVIAVLEDPQMRHVVTCCTCEYWDKESGLTARECMKHGRITIRYSYCSEGREKE